MAFDRWYSAFYIGRIQPEEIPGANERTDIIGAKKKYGCNILAL